MFCLVVFSIESFLCLIPLGFFSRIVHVKEGSSGSVSCKQETQGRDRLPVSRAKCAPKEGEKKESLEESQEESPVLYQC